MILFALTFTSTHSQFYRKFNFIEIYENRFSFFYLFIFFCHFIFSYIKYSRRAFVIDSKLYFSISSNEICFNSTILFPPIHLKYQQNKITLYNSIYSDTQPLKAWSVYAPAQIRFSIWHLMHTQKKDCISVVIIFDEKSRYSCSISSLPDRLSISVNHLSRGQNAKITKFNLTNEKKKFSEN